ncbi:VOC family protein [Mobiluncus sp.]|uniref:VOC family protein n=1 Tax=Mobiluncus sp. TaxID=47293 RepID=UPI002A918ABE|nr:VOC family protein [Mobiluncus sp.]MDY6076874.1 VOC family protein [Mobiluncus sp.]
MKQVSLKRRAFKKLCKGATKLGLLAAAGYGAKAGVTNAMEYKAVGKEEWVERKQRSLRAMTGGAGINWGLGHTGVTVSNFERSVAWYDRVFGMKLMNYMEISGDDLKPVERLYHVEGLKLVRLGFMSSRSGNVLELFEFDPPLPGFDQPGSDTPGGERETWNRPGYTHIAFNVSNVKGWVNRLRAEGVEFMNEPVRSSGADWAFFRDPDGNLIEVIDLHVTRLALGKLGVPIGTIMKYLMFKSFYRTD